MGYSRKEEIARLKREHKESKDRKAYNREQRVRFLIVCEGTKTEPKYFNALINNCSSIIREVTVNGVGKATVRLVEETKVIKDDLENRNSMRFDRVWVVFDKDSFDDFNEAIRLANRFGFETAWTNEAFELWYVLHFEYLSAGIDRKDYIKRLTSILRNKTGDKKYKYEKGDDDNYILLRKYGDEEVAKRYARRLRNLYRNKNYASHNPCTRVDLLVDELENPESLLLNRS